jgi:hypothetical protein
MRERAPKRLLVIAAALAVAAVVVAPGFAKAPVKQNGTTPAFDAFTSICAVPGYASYGNCGGDVTTYSEVDGRINAVLKDGRYTLGFSFSHLTPGTSYRLWGNDGSFFAIATAVANASGVAKFTFQTRAPAGLGFDLNTVEGNITLVTSYWSGQLLAKRADGTLYALSG